MDAGDRHNGFRDGIRYAVSWLHDRAREMNDPWAKAVLNVTANDLGRLGVERTQQAKANLLEICLARAAQQNAPERKLCDGCDGHECDDDCQYPMTDPFQAQRS